MKTHIGVVWSLIALGAVACESDVTKVGNPGGTASLTSLADLPELDVSRYDTSSSNYTSPATLTTKGVVSSSGRFSRDGCDAKSYKQEMIELGLFAEEFLCLYKMSEKHYPDQFSIQTDDFNYYTIESQEDTLLGRIGYFSEGFGEIDEPVLVLDECEGGKRTAEMRVTASSVDEELTGSGYFIRFIETDYLGEEASDESLAFTIDTREAVWEITVDFTRIREENDGNWYGTLGLGLDTNDNFNLFTTATYDEDLEGIYEITSNTVFGPWSELEGFSIGGSSEVNVIQSANPESEVIGQITGFVFNDSTTLPAIQLDATEISEFPFYAQLTALTDPATSVTRPSIDFADEWDCTVPAGRESVEIDLTLPEIEEELFNCEGENEALEDELDCAALEEE